MRPWRWSPRTGSPLTLHLVEQVLHDPGRQPAGTTSASTGWKAAAREVLDQGRRIVALVATMGTTDGFGVDDLDAVTALLDRLLHHAHILKCGPRSRRTKVTTL